MTHVVQKGFAKYQTGRCDGDRPGQGTGTANKDEPQETVIRHTDHKWDDRSESVKKAVAEYNQTLMAFQQMGGFICPALPVRSFSQKLPATETTELKTNQISGQGPEKSRADHPENLEMIGLAQNG